VRLCAQLARLGTPALEPAPAPDQRNQRYQDQCDDCYGDDGFSAHPILLLEIARISARTRVGR
jgi:hypothetical protein